MFMRNEKDMGNASLNELIDYLEYGTNLHIGVLFLGSYGNEKLALPFERTVHSAPVCENFKIGKQGQRRCFKCRNAALRKAINTGDSFGGLCINGVYEYTRPVMMDGNVVCVIFVGNIMPPEENAGLLKNSVADRNIDGELPGESMQKDFGEEKCVGISDILESYIKMILSIYPVEDDSKKYNPLMENLKAYVEANLEYDIAFSLLAKMFHYNEKYLGRIFKKETGMSLRRYINFRRTERAKDMLIATDSSIMDISVKCGFNNVTYFNRVFKRFYGATPGEIRAGSKIG